MAWNRTHYLPFPGAVKVKKKKKVGVCVWGVGGGGHLLGMGKFHVDSAKPLAFVLKYGFVVTDHSGAKYAL